MAGFYGTPTSTYDPTTQPVITGAPSGSSQLPQPPTAPADTSAPQGMSVYDYLRDLFGGGNRQQLTGEGDFFNEFDVTRMGSQFDPNFLNQMRRWLESLGIKMQYKPSDAGQPSGRITLPNGITVDTNVGGQWGWLIRGILSGGGGTNFSGTGGTSGIFGRPATAAELAFGDNHASQDLTANSVFSDPATVEWEQMLRQLVQRMQQPYSDPDVTATQDYLRKYFERLQGPAYTPQELDLLNTQQIDPLTADRDANRQKVLLWAQSHGMTPESGPVQQLLADADRQYEALRTRSRADIATRAIDLGRENEAKATQVGSMLSALKEHVFDKNEGRFGQSVQTFKQIPELADTRLQLAMQALGMGGGGAVNGLGNALNLLGQFQNSKSGGGTDSDAQFWASLLGAAATAAPYFAA